MTDEVQAKSRDEYRPSIESRHETIRDTIRK